MATIRERREARAGKRREWEAARQEKVEAASKEVHQLAGLEPLGEPIHDGSAGRRQRAAKKRIYSKSRQAAEHAEMARRHGQAADTIESQLERSVYSDDPDAIERLRERIADNEAKREAMKARNAEFRKAHREKLKGLPGYQRDQAMPHQAFELRNLGGRIRQARTRLAELERSAPATTQTYIIEKVDPYSTHPELTDEEYHCKGSFEAAMRVEDLVGGDALDIAAELLGEGTYRHVDEETGVEVTARVMEGVR